jgi:hypothetical protein
MKTVTCKQCGWVAFEVSRAHATSQVEEFNNFYRTLSQEDQESFYGSKEASISDYERCFRCGGPHHQFRDAKEGDCPNGCTLNPIISRVE